jgi:hypothetical protein
MSSSVSYGRGDPATVNAVNAKASIFAITGINRQYNQGEQQLAMKIMIHIRSIVTG